VEDAIHLFTQFFTHKDAQKDERNQILPQPEFDEPAHNKIHLLNEKIYTTAELGVSSPKSSNQI
jgi:hypothetical protein